MSTPRLANATFVDTSGWYALLIERDRNHILAVRQFRSLAAERRRLVLTNYVLSETYTLLRVRRGADAGMQFLQRVRATSTVMKVRVEEDWEAKAEAFLTKFREHELSYTDATSFIAMKELGLTDVMTFDSDFTIAGFQTL